MDIQSLPVYENQNKNYDDKIHTNFWCLKVPKDGIECKYFTVISINSWLVYDSKYYLQVYLDSFTFTYKIVDIQMIDYLDDNLFEADED